MKKVERKGWLHVRKNHSLFQRTPWEWEEVRILSSKSHFLEDTPQEKPSWIEYLVQRKSGEIIETSSSYTYEA